MENVCLLIPIIEDRAADAREFMRELERSRKDEYDLSERRIGITRETWHLASAPSGDVLVAHIETEDFARALTLFSESHDDFDVWFKRRLADSTGLDLSNPPPMALPELLSSYDAGEMLSRRPDPVTAT